MDELSQRWPVFVFGIVSVNAAFVAVSCSSADFEAKLKCVVFFSLAGSRESRIAQRITINARSEATERGDCKTHCSDAGDTSTTPLTGRQP